MLKKRASHSDFSSFNNADRWSPLVPEENQQQKTSHEADADRPAGHPDAFLLEALPSDVSSSSPFPRQNQALNLSEREQETCTSGILTVPGVTPQHSTGL